MQEALFHVEQPRRPARGPTAFAAVLGATGGRYWLLEPDQRRRMGRVARRMQANGVEPDRISAEGTRMRAKLGRSPTLGELADTILG
jgi:hypothetical protein